MSFKLIVEANSKIKPLFESLIKRLIEEGLDEDYMMWITPLDSLAKRLDMDPEDIEAQEEAKDIGRSFATGYLDEFLRSKRATASKKVVIRGIKHRILNMVEQGAPGYETSSYVGSEQGMTGNIAKALEKIISDVIMNRYGMGVLNTSFEDAEKLDIEAIAESIEDDDNVIV